MAELVLGALCRRVLIDRQLRMASLIDLIEAIEVRGTAPANETMKVAEPFYHVSVWSRDGDEQEAFDIRVRCIGPKRRSAIKENISTLALEANNKVRHVVEITHLPLDQGPGRYLFETSIRAGSRWKKVGAYPIDVKMSFTPAPTKAAPSSQTAP